VCLSETHITEKVYDSELHIENYSFVRCNSFSAHTGGVTIYVKKNIDFEILINEMKENNWFCAIKTNYIEKCVYGVLYHSPSSSNADFIEIFENWCDDLFENANDCKILITGDFNIDFSVENFYQKKLKETIQSFGLIQMSNNFTRITDTSKTIIDLVLTNDKTIKVVVASEDKISDHETLIIDVNSINKFKEEEEKEITCWKKYSSEALKIELKKIDWNTVNNYEINERARIINENLINSVNKLLVTKKILKADQNKWFDNELKTLEKRVQQCRKEIGKSTNSKEYKAIRNIYKNKIRSASCNDIYKKIEKHKDDPKELWKELKKLTDYKTKTKSYIEFESQNIFDKSEISNKFNDYFISSIKKINESIPLESDPRFKIDNLEIDNSRQFLFRLVERKEIEDIIKNMKKKSSLDNLNITVFNDAFEVIGDVFTKLINDILLTGVFPNIYKISTVIPIEKVKNTIKCEDFRPINMLTIEEKILEQIVKVQLLKYIEDQNILCSQQSGFRSKYSCETALNLAIDGWKGELQLKKIIAVVFLDLKRAFETIDRNRLLQKLHKIGIRGVALKLFKSYLTNRSQRCRYEGDISQDKPNDLGVPQGTVIGPLLFILYINDIVQSVLSSNVLLFADDTLITISGDSSEEVQRKLNTDLALVYKWLNINKLKLNVDKTKCMIITNKNIQKDEIIINIGGATIERVAHLKYLGILLDDALKLDEHIDFICKKMGRKYGFMKRINKKLTTSSKILLYKSTIATHIEYCSTMLFLANEGQKTRLQKMQNKIMRLILKCGRRTKIKWMLDTLQWLSVRQRLDLNTMIFLYKIVHKNMPEYLTEKIIHIRDKHDYNTRVAAAGNFGLPKMTMAGSQNCLFYKGVRMFNGLDYEIKNAKTINEFKNKMIKYLKQKGDEKL